MKRIGFLVFVLGAFCFLNIPLVGATDSSTIRITPSILEELVEGGEVLEKRIKVVNYSDISITMYAYLMDFKAADEFGKAELIVPNTEEGNYISSWLNITNEVIKFSPGEEKSIPFKISVPADIGPGGYYGAIVFGTEPPKVRAEGEEKGAAVSISQQTASLVLLQVAGDVYEKALIKEFNTDKRFYNTPFEVNFHTKIDNLGNVHIKPIGLVEVRNMLGKKAAVITVNDKGGNILPESSRIFKNRWKEDFGFGRYEASLAVSFGTPAHKGGEGRKTLAIKTYFWILPAKIVIFTVIGLMLAIILAVVFLKFYKKRTVRRAMEQFGVRKGRTNYNIRRRRSQSGQFIKTFLLLMAAVISFIGAIYFLFF